MKNLTKNIIIFVLIAAFILSGLASIPMVKLFGGSAYRLVKRGFGISETIDTIDSSINERLSYHFQLVDLQSAVLRFTGTQYVNKSDTVIARTEKGMLSEERRKINDNDLEKNAKLVTELKRVANDNGAQFLYVFAPTKSCFLELPAGVQNYAEYNYNRFIKKLERNGVETLNILKEKEEEHISVDEMYFKTDHHWKPEYGLWATDKICAELKNRYGYNYNEKYTDIKNYNIELYKNWFMGSSAKKTGRYFNSSGIDDISLITPKFKSDLIEEQPAKNEKKEGDFNNTVLFMDEFIPRDLHNKNPYAAYSGGDFREQIIKNNLNESGEKILIVRDSYACVVTPFLALNCSELRTVDVRNYEYYVGERTSLKNYIEEQDPDYVIVLYTECDNEAGHFDFF